VKRHDVQRAYKSQMSSSGAGITVVPRTAEFLFSFKSVVVTCYDAV